MHVSARTVERHVLKIAEKVKELQTVELKDAPVFSVALDESVDVNDITHLVIVARYRDRAGTQVAAL